MFDRPDCHYLQNVHIFSQSNGGPLQLWITNHIRQEVKDLILKVAIFCEHNDWLDNTMGKHSFTIISKEFKYSLNMVNL